MDPSWDRYLEGFHEERAGITERILRRCRDGDLDPYAWAAEPVSAQGSAALDVACGNGPMHDELTGWIGCDRAAAELRDATIRARRPVIRSSATRLPVATASVPTVVTTMSLQAIDDPVAALEEIARVLQPAGTVVVLLPASRPLRWRDALLYLGLQLSLRQRIRYPNDAALRPDRVRVLAGTLGLRVVSDERRTFRFPLDTRTRVRGFLDSLYLPAIESRHFESAQRLLERRIGSSLAVPLRRVVLTSSS